MKNYVVNENKKFDQAGNEYYQYLKTMKKDMSEDAAEYNANFMTF